MEFKFLNENGQEGVVVNVLDVVFGCDYNEVLIYQVVVVYQVNVCQGNCVQKDCE